MEVSNSAVLRAHSSYYCSGGRIDTQPYRRLAFTWENRQIPSRFRGLRSSVRMVLADPCDVGGGFKEKGHLEYYDKSIAPLGEEKKKGKKEVVGKEWSTISMKKRSKLLKGLEKNLSMFSELGFGLEPDQTKGEIISQAAEVLLQQLEHLKSEEKKSKSRVREMEKTKSPKMKMIMEEDSESSSSSSESSDNECEGQVVNISNLRTTPMTSIQQPPLILEGETSTEAMHQESVVTSLEATSIGSTSQSQSNHLVGTARGLVAKGSICTTSSSSFMTAFNEENNRPAFEVDQSLKRIQVCMGGKCKKSGAQALADEFSRVLGVEGSVVTCKCMGKCKTAPNVKVFTGREEIGGDDSIRTPMNPLCLGVGLEDVELIVANYFGIEAVDACVAASSSGLLPSV